MLCSLSLVSLFVVVCATFPSYISAAITDVELQGLSVTVHGTPYLISPFPAVYAPVLAQADVGTSIYGFVPVTVIQSAPTGPSRFNLNNTITGYLAKDDVFNRGFLQGVIIYHDEQSENLGPTLDIDSMVTDLKNHYNTSSVVFQSLREALSTVPPGPYFYHLETGHLHHPYRLYLDSQIAFVTGIIPAANGSYAEIPASISGTSATIGVPSRLYFCPTPETPLAGVRVAIKDIFDIKGVRIGAGSRAYRDIYLPATAHSTAVQRLRDAGAVIVGKVKTSQFAAPEHAIDAIDYQAPLNPRGDGYQEPGSSSSGSAVAVASYDWLDAALGSDTGGSVRIPAALNGVFGNRPTHGLVDLQGAVPLSAEYDTAGLLSRDPILWSLAADVLYGKLNRSYSYPKKLTVLDSRSPLGEAQQTLTTSFINSLASYLSADVSTLNYTSHWEATRPSDAPASVEDLLKLTWIIPCAQNQARTVRDLLYANYAEKFNGRRPFTNPSTLGMWKFGDQYPDLVDDATRNRTIFTHWWSQNVIQKHLDTCSDSIALYIANEATPGYIQNYGEFIGVLDSMQSSFISVFTEQPEYVLPLGESSYYSKITEHEEMLPVTINIMAASGCDGMLFSLVEDLTRQGIIAAVGTGATIMSEESL